MKLKYDEFEETLWDFVSCEIVDDSYWEFNYDQIEKITKELYDLYLDNDVKIELMSSILETMLLYMK